MKTTPSAAQTARYKPKTNFGRVRTCAAALVKTLLSKVNYGKLLFRAWGDVLGKGQGPCPRLCEIGGRRVKLGGHHPRNTRQRINRALNAQFDTCVSYNLNKRPEPHDN